LKKEESNEHLIWDSERKPDFSGLFPNNKRKSRAKYVEMGLVLLCGTVLVLLLGSCTTFHKKAVQITWPDSVDYLRAFGEVNINWRDLKYSGTMSLRLRYPDKLYMEVYGPFGETAFCLRKDQDGFLVINGDERVTDQQVFEKMFGMKLSAFIDDIGMRTVRKGNKGGNFVERDGYNVIYDLGGDDNRICWRGVDGTICIRFLEARFDREEDFGKGSDGGL
jgi:hypothetical protein